jgi:NAD dependent epimerase/dehydratase family enzyme
VVGEAIARAAYPPKVWLQMSTATLYAHSLEAAHDDFTGSLGGPGSPGPRSWDFSVSIGRRWEEAQTSAPTPRTRKVALRSAIVLMPGPRSIFNILLGLTRWGLGGTIAGGRQVMSWIHGEDFIRAIRFLLEREDIEGPIIIAAPGPLPQKKFMANLRKAMGMSFGLPATAWMMEIAAFLIRTESELTLKSRNVYPARLLKEGFQFTWPDWEPSAADLVRRAKNA